MRIKTLFSILLAIMTLGVTILLSACSNEEEIPGGNQEEVTSNIVGVWYCVYQEWTEDGETDSKTYEPSSAYSMEFNSDGTGYMQSGRDELFEIGCSRGQYFTYSVSRKDKHNWIHTDVYDGQDYKVVELSESSLSMTWEDDGYIITCKFVKVKDIGSITEGNKDIVNLIGTWYCTFQEWTADGETDSKTYEPSSKYSMIFNEDGSGYMQSGGDELFEIGCSRGQYFKYYTYNSGKDSWIHTDVYGGQDYYVNYISKQSLTMTWTDRGYTIKCEFTKVE